jgi:multidrug transporter EmrE-like cation transporter
MKYSFFIFIFLAVLFETIADILFKYWSINVKSSFVVAGLLLYALGTLMWALSLRHEGLAKAVTIFTVINLIAVVMAGVLIFNEQLSMVHKIGIALGIGSICLMQM